MAKNTPDLSALTPPQDNANPDNNPNLDADGNPIVSQESIDASARAIDPTIGQINPVPTNKPAAPEKKWKKGAKAYVLNPNDRPMRDPHTGDRFPPGEVVKVTELGNWTIMQLEAGILREGEADKVGEKPKKKDE